VSRACVSLDDLRRVYEERLAELRRVAAAIVGDRDLGCDVVQDAFVRAVRQRASFSGRGSLEGWVWRIVVNTARDASARVRRIDGEESIGDAASVVGEGDERRQLVRTAIEQLPERQRLVLFLRVYADLDYRSIADAVGVKEGTVAATLNAAHRRLRELLSEARL
jgi:RNA polymerase sigma factor (sigma-70 family)